MRQLGTGRIASICGRYYAMDRDKRWDRVKAAFDLLVNGETEYVASSPARALADAYDRGESDEFVLPTRIDDEAMPWSPISDGDAVIFMNYRADRARELTQALALDDFSGFPRSHKPQTHLVTLTEYEKGLPVAVAFEPLHLPNVLGEVISKQGWKQLRIAETEKYAHVTFFFNGGVEAPFPGEDRYLVPSPKVATYDLQPEMNAPLLTDKLVEAIEGGTYDLIVCNYANPDMVGHTGNFAAAVKAIETIDDCLKRVTEALLRVGGEAIITADHGNAEKMRDRSTGQAHTAHTSDPVPCVLVSSRRATVTEAPGILSDVAPTLLTMMELDIPQDMTGKPLFHVDS
jgi:2,3-bisphosphoglycerate-independent phosphoglycerate mutase